MNEEEKAREMLSILAQVKPSKDSHKSIFKDILKTLEETERINKVLCKDCKKKINS